MEKTGGKDFSHCINLAISDAMRANPPAKTGDTIQARLVLDGGFIGFEGHFPGAPILPAFVQMLLAQVVAEKMNNCFLQVISVKNAKFLLPIRPEKEILIECRQQSSGEKMSCHVRLNLKEGLAANFTIDFEPKRNPNGQALFSCS